MQSHSVVSRNEWMAARKALLAEEKTWTRQRDRLAEKRRALPWVLVDKDYTFDGAAGPVTLSDLFDGRSQLVVYHFMFGPAWQEGCPSCSLVADHVDSARQHFEHVDVSFAAVSRGPIEKLEAYRRRMGWGFSWVSSANNDFNFDYQVSFPEQSREGGVFYNFQEQRDPEIDELPGISVFQKDEDGAIYHTYSAFARGVEMFLGVYAYLDIVPKGRNETKKGGMADWVRRHDRYDNDGRTSRATAQG
jgi:predicted dithiol-disulfide oxidoreductase (DUF899 family)